ncbi:kinase-like domain-containing protein [Rhizophagus clarus]|nr:kinase-like domain-containing protein [Rhizophagus clarus]
MLYQIISGLEKIHEQNLIHCDFHDGAILFHEDEKDEDNKDKVFIGDFGLCKTANFLKEKFICGVMAFMAPEVLNFKSFTLASDIYSFSMIMWEFTSGVPPFNDRAHDFELKISICKGERPEIIENTPQCYVDLMKKSWDKDPLKRPSASEVSNIIANWIFLPYNGQISEELKSNIMELMNAPVGNNNLITKSHQRASRSLDFTSRNVNGISECLDCLI